MNVKMTCKECGQLREAPVKITEIKSDEDGRRMVLELSSQIDRDKGLLDVFAREGVKINRVGNALVIEADMEVITDDAEETTSTPAPEPATVGPKKATPKRRGNPPAMPKDD